MTTEPNRHFFAEQRKQLTEMSDALEEMIGTALPKMAREIRGRLNSFNLKLERSETAASKARTRSTQTNNAALEAITSRLNILEGDVSAAVGRLADHIENHTFAHEPDGFPGNHVPH